MAEIKLEHITKRFGDVVAVDDVNLEIHDQEFVVFLRSFRVRKNNDASSNRRIGTP